MSSAGPSAQNVDSGRAAPVWSARVRTGAGVPAARPDPSASVGPLVQMSSQRRSAAFVSSSSPVITAPLLGVLCDWEDLVGDQTVRLAVDGGGGLGVGRLHQAEDLARLLVHPVADVVHPVGA